MSSYYRLKVIRLEELKWKHPLHFKNPNLYVKVKLGDVTRKTRETKRSRFPVWNEELAFPAAGETAKFEIKVKHGSTDAGSSYRRRCCEACEFVSRLRRGGAAQDVQRLEIVQSVDAFNAKQSTDDGKAQLGDQRGLNNAVGGVLRRLEGFKKAMDAISEIHPFFNAAWK
ncbi:hypothetical protein ACEPAF_8926 [Sanghuangporus sanghuang]